MCSPCSSPFYYSELPKRKKEAACRAGRLSFGPWHVAAADSTPPPVRFLANRVKKMQLVKIETLLTCILR